MAMTKKFEEEMLSVLKTEMPKSAYEAVLDFAAKHEHNAWWAFHTLHLHKVGFHCPFAEDADPVPEGDYTDAKYPIPKGHKEGCSVCSPAKAPKTEPAKTLSSVVWNSGDAILSVPPPTCPQVYFTDKHGEKFKVPAEEIKVWKAVGTFGDPHFEILVPSLSDLAQKFWHNLPDYSVNPKAATKAHWMQQIPPPKPIPPKPAKPKAHVASVSVKKGQQVVLVAKEDGSVHVPAGFDFVVVT